MYRTRIVFKKGTTVVADIKGREMVGEGPNRNVLEKVIATEQALEQLTGFRVHIINEEGDQTR